MISGIVFFAVSVAVKVQQLAMKVLCFSSLDLKYGFGEELCEQKKYINQNFDLKI